MQEPKLAARIIAFLLIAAFVCVIANFPLYRSEEELAETADLQSYDKTASFAEHQPTQTFSETYDNLELLSLCSSGIRVLAGRRSGSQSLLFRGQQTSLTDHSLEMVHRHVPVAASGNGRLSLLALSLGGNSPPVYHA